jgi:hypothetical protein
MAVGAERNSIAAVVAEAVDMDAALVDRVLAKSVFIYIDVAAVVPVDMVFVLREPIDAVSVIVRT